MADPVASIAGSAAKSVRPFRSSEAYVEAMKEDLAEWLNALYGLGLPGGGEGFLLGLATGTTLCQHANAVTEAARALAAGRPAHGVAFQAHGVAPGSFVARDNVATFIGWCRSELGVPEVLMFETEDLVLRKNEKSVVLCLLEVARRGARLGLLAPRLVQFEQEIERELRASPSAPSAPAAATAAEGTSAGEAATGPASAAAPGAASRGPRMTLSDLRNLDELVSSRPGHTPGPTPTRAPPGTTGCLQGPAGCAHPRRGRTHRTAGGPASSPLFLLVPTVHLLRELHSCVLRDSGTPALHWELQGFRGKCPAHSQAPCGPAQSSSSPLMTPEAILLAQPGLRWRWLPPLLGPGCPCRPRSQPGPPQNVCPFYRCVCPEGGRAGWPWAEAAAPPPS